MPIVHESYLSPKDYPYLTEHVLAPSHEQLADTSELVQQLARELPLNEAAGLLGPAYPTYLDDMFRHWAGRQQPIQALPYAEALVAYHPEWPAYRQLRAWCRARQPVIVYAAVLTDYDWLAHRSLRGYDHWLRVMQQADPDSSSADHTDLARHEHGRDLVQRAGYCLASAWAWFNLGNLAEADEAFGRAFGLPGLDLYHGYDFAPWEGMLLPPLPDAAYLRWQLEQPAFWPYPVQQWFGLATNELKRIA